MRRSLYALAVLLLSTTSVTYNAIQAVQHKQSREACRLPVSAGTVAAAGA